MTCPPDESLLPLLTDEPPGDVRDHLADCPRCRRRLDSLRTEVSELRALATRPDPPPPPSAPRPALIGRYIVVGRIDSGGQSDVYRAVHPTLDRELVVKLGRAPEPGGPDLRSLLVSEGKVLAGLDHPNLVRVIDMDYHDGRPFVVMELVRGRTLHALVQDRPVAPRDAARIVSRVARALEVVHARGIVHQDVKPQNIIIDETGEPRLIDFGLARFRHAWDAAGSPTGGTPAFIAPEQARGEVERVGPRSDVFALGGVLYFLLTRTQPFRGESVTEVRSKAAACAFDRELLNTPGVPRSLRAACLRAMAADPEKRQPGAGALADELDSFLGRNRRAFLAAGGTALVALGVAGYLAWPTREATNPQPTAATPSLEIQVTRDGKYLSLDDAMPLDTERDRIRIVGKLPAGRQPVLYSLSPTGRATRLEADASPADDSVRAVFPAGGGQVPFDRGPGGTEFVLLCGFAGGKPAEDLCPLIESTLGQLPALPPRVRVRMDRAESRREVATPLGPRESDPVADAEYRLDRLRQRLRDRCEFVLGIAFSHRPTKKSG